MNWPRKKLGEVVDVMSGVWGEDPGLSDVEVKAIKVSDIKEGGIVDFFNATPRSINRKDFKKNLLMQGDILVVKSSGSMKNVVSGRCAFIDKKIKDYVPVNFLMALRPKKDKILPIFLFHILSSQVARDHVLKIVSGSTYPNLRKEPYLSFEIPLPSIMEQRRIVGRIEGLFAKIDEAQKLRGESKKAAFALLQSALNEIFDSSKSKKWEEKELKELCDVNPRDSLKDLADDLEVSFIPMRSVDDINGIITENEVRELLKVKKGYTNFKNDDVIFAKMTPCMENGKAALVDNLINGIGFGSTEFHVIRSRGKILPKLVYYYVRRQVFRNEAKKKMTGSAGQKRVPRGFLEKSKIIVPPIGEQKKIVAYLSSLSEKVRKLQDLQQQTADDFKTLKKSVLSQAFSGKL